MAEILNPMLARPASWTSFTIGGEGTRPYEGATFDLRLLDSQSFDSGVTLLRDEPRCA